MKCFILSCVFVHSLAKDKFIQLLDESKEFSAQYPITKLLDKINKYPENTNSIMEFEDDKLHSQGKNDLTCLFILHGRMRLTELMWSHPGFFTSVLKVKECSELFCHVVDVADSSGEK